tara:strand:- start:457 stop:717 length:261 start_codon:yes stop_codon:yes gene_type:complete
MNDSYPFLNDETSEFLVDYYLIKDTKIEIRVSPLMLQVGTRFEHQSGTYQVIEILTKQGGIQVMCELVLKETTLFNMVNNMRNNNN